MLLGLGSILGKLRQVRDDLGLLNQFIGKLDDLTKRNSIDGVLYDSLTEDTVEIERILQSGSAVFVGPGRVQGPLSGLILDESDLRWTGARGILGLRGRLIRKRGELRKDVKDMRENIGRPIQWFRFGCRAIVRPLSFRGFVVNINAGLFDWVIKIVGLVASITIIFG